MNRRGAIEFATLATIVAPAFVWLLAVVEPEKAGIVGALMYLFAQHELGKAKDSLLLSVPVLSFFGYGGSWVVTHVIVTDFFTSASDGMTQFLSAVFGFLAYDTILLAGGNTGSIIKYFIDWGRKKLTKDKQ